MLILELVRRKVFDSVVKKGRLGLGFGSGLSKLVCFIPNSKVVHRISLDIIGLVLLLSENMICKRSFLCAIELIFSVLYDTEGRNISIILMKIQVTNGYIWV